MKDITQIVKSLEESRLQIKGVSETIKNEATGKKGGFPLGTLGTSLLGNLLAGRAVLKSGQGKNRAGEDTASADKNY